MPFNQQPRHVHPAQNGVRYAVHLRGLGQEFRSQQLFQKPYGFQIALHAQALERVQLGFQRLRARPDAVPEHMGEAVFAAADLDGGNERKAGLGQR